MPEAAFFDMEAALVELLGDLASIGTVTPDDFTTAGNLPFIRVGRFGGFDDFITDTARVDIDTFASTRSASLALAEQIRQLLIEPGGKVTSLGTIDRATTDLAPNEVPWGTQMSIRRFTASYTISARR